MVIFRRRDSNRKGVLILVENLSVPFDRRVWQEACTLRDAGYAVSVIGPTGAPPYDGRFEVRDGIHLYRYPLVEASTAAGYLCEYATALFWTLVLSIKIWATRGFDAIHACNPPDLFFAIAAPYKLLGKKFVFDHHDINPELYEAKFGRRDLYHRLLLKLERMSFFFADVSIATNDSYRRIAIRRGRMPPSRVFVVRSGPSAKRMRVAAADPSLKHGRRFLVGYVGVMGRQEGIDCLLRAARHIIRDLGRHDIHFTLVGGGTALADMQELAKQLKVDSHVTFTGRVPDAELLAVLNTADVCVNPDRANAMNDMSTMNKIMEYMALGKPIVQFDLTEGRYSARAASLYARRNDIRDFAAKIVALLDDPAQRARMGEFGRRRFLHELEWTHQAHRLLCAYETLWQPHAAQHNEPSAT
ncbi:MAG TPA: glycosyltransferase family 4 protein [Gammaproteobacteria bacterium]|nr:glycosyltransferase family 4 protein [Gammaproteobacteria bacterium]